MLFLGLGGAPTQLLAAKIGAAEAELDMVTDMFNRLVETCQNKCLDKTYKEGEVSRGESVCIDRCVAKYFDVNVKVGEKMQNVGGAMRR